MVARPNDQNKRAYSFEVDFLDPNKITSKVTAALKCLDNKLDVVIFCHGVINYQGGIDGNLPDWDYVQKINVRASVQILSLCI